MRNMTTSKADRRNDRDDAASDIIGDLDRLKLLVVLDAILVEGSLARAGQKLGKSPSVMSRLHRQLQEYFGQELFERTAQGIVPTPFAEAMRPRLRALVAETNALLVPDTDMQAPPAAMLPQHPPLALDEWTDPGTGPGPRTIAWRLAVSGADTEPTRRFATYIAATGNTPGQTRPLNEAEAEDAMSLLLSGQIPDIQIGALLIALQSRGVTDQELAGFVRAARRHGGLPPFGGDRVDLDWPVYLSPRVQGAPLLIHAARLVARAGYRVLMHGPENEIAHRAFLHAGLPVAESVQDACAPETAHAPVFLPTERFAPDVRQLHRLYPLFMMPNVAQVLSAMLNPGGARTTLTGMRTARRPRLQRDAAARLGWESFAVLSGNRDIAQVVPGRSQELILLRDGEMTQTSFTCPLPPGNGQPPDAAGLSRLETWQAIWDGSLADPVSEAAIIETAAIALDLLAAPGTPLLVSRQQAQRLWADRRR